MVGPPPLQGLKVLEFAGLAPGPFAGLLLSDAGAHVVRIDRAIPGKTHTPGATAPPTPDLLTRHKSSIAVDLKAPAGVALVRRLAQSADVLIDPFRPGVLEKLGLGPDELCALNPRLIYARMTGFRRDGRYAAMAGHDINYLAVGGVLSLLGRAGQNPHAPYNILGDFAGGGATLFQGILLAVIARATTGRGQVVEANMADGASYLATFPRQLRGTPMGNAPRGENVLDGGCPWYDTYATRDGLYMAVGALEPAFFAALLRGLGLDADWNERRHDRAAWPALRRLLAAAFAARPRAHWEVVFDGTDACCTPVLDYAELAADPRREGDQRPPVALHATPLLAVTQNDAAAVVGADVGSARRGQGPGWPGNGYEGQPLLPGQGGEEALAKWFGLRVGQEVGVEEGGLVLDAKLSKL